MGYIVWCVNLQEFGFSILWRTSRLKALQSFAA